MKCCILLVTILLWLFTFVNCEIVCNPLESGKKKCCTNFKYVDGKCTECPKGSFGEECKSQCPNGYYGKLCMDKCNCTHNQICDVQDGCAENKTVECPLGSFGKDCRSSCSDGYYGVACKETCNFMAIMETTSTEQQTTESNGYYQGIFWNHLYGVPLVVVIIALVILLSHTHRRRQASDQVVDSRHDQQVQETASEAVQLNQNTVQSDYEEICEIDAMYSHTLTFSCDYNELSFSRSRRDRSESSPTESHYDTSKNCLLKIKESKSEWKHDAGGNPYSVAKLVMDTENKVFEVKEESVDLHPGIWRREDIRH